MEAKEGIWYSSMGKKTKFLFLLGMIAGAEYAVMQVLPLLGIPQGGLEDVLDASLLVIFISPLIYLFVKTDEALHKSEALFRSLAEHSQLGIYIFKDGRFIYANPQFAEMSGYSQEELQASRNPVEMLVAEEDRKLIKTDIFKLLSGEVKSSIDYIRGIKKDGSVIDLEILGSMLRFDGGPAIIGTLMDITERKRAEVALMESEERYRVLFQNMTEGYAYCRMIFEQGRPSDFVYIDVNDAFGKLTGLKDVVGRNISEAIPGIRESNPEIFEVMGRVVSTGEPESFETYSESFGGWLDVSVYRAEEGHFVAVFDNITERKRAEEALRKSRDFYLTLFERFPVMIWQAGTDKICNYFNNTWLEFTGRTREQELGDGWMEGVHPDDLAHCVATFIQAFDMREAFEIEYRLRHQSGEYRWIVDIGRPFNGLDGEFAGYLGACFDITERKRAEEKLRVGERQHAAVASLGQLALEGKGLDKLCDAAVHLVSESLEVEYSKVLELLPDGGSLLLRAGVGWKEGLVGRATVGAGLDSQAGYTLLSDGPVIVEDLRSETRFSGPPLLHDHGVISGMSLVIKGFGRPWGVLGAHTTRMRKFSEEDVNFLQAVAHVLAEAIERMRVEQMVRDRNERLAMLNRIDRAMNQAHTLDEVLEVLMENLARAVKMESGSFYMYDPKKGSLATQKCYSYGRPKNEACISPSALPGMDKLLEGKDPVIISHFETGSDIYKAFGVSSLMLLPLAKSERLVGVIALFNKSAGLEFKDEETAFALQVADQAVIAIENARLVQSLMEGEANLTKRNRELSALNAVADVIATEHDLGAMLQRVLDKTLSLSFLDIEWKGVIFLVDEGDPDKLNMAAQAGLAPELLLAERQIDMGHCLCGRAAQTGDVIRSTDCFTDPHHTFGFPGMKKHGHVVVPIKAKDRVLGVMTFYLAPDTTTTEADERILLSIASQLAVAIENRRLFQDILEGKREWEETFDAIEDLVTVHSPDFTILRANKAAARAAGVSVTELIGRKCYEVFHGTKEPIPLCPAMKLIEGVDSGLVYDVPMGDKSYEIMVYPLKDEGRMVAYVHIAKDITERKRFLNQLSERTRQATLAAEVGAALTKGTDMRTMLQNCAGAVCKHLDAAFARIWTLNEKENVLELQASAGMYTHIDGPHGRVPVGMFKIGLIALERRPHLTNSVVGDPRVGDQEWAKREGMVAFAGYPLIVRDRLVGVMAMFARRPLPETTLSALSSVVDTIAVGIERLRSVDSLKESESKFRGLVEQSLVGVYIIQDGKFRYVNPRLAEIFEYTPEEIIDIISPEELVYAEDRPLVMENIRRRESEEVDVLHYSFRGITKHGRVITIDIHGSNTVYNGRPAGIGTLLDITETLAAQDELVKRTQQMAILKEASRQLEEVNRLKSEFLANMSHELRTPLNAVIGLSQVLHEGTYGPVNAKQSEYLDGINQSGQHLLSLINEILDLSKIEAGKEKLEMAEFSMLDVLKGSFIMEKEKAMKHHIELVHDIGAEVGNFYADQRRVKQILFNLLSNAIKFTKPGGKVGLRAGQDASWLTITVWDTGIGIPEDKKHMLFQPFQMLDSSLSKVHEGTGLGLVLTKKLVEMHGGTITFESKEGDGTAFTVMLPVEPPRKPPLLETGRASGPGQAITENVCAKGNKVMVVEDNPMNMLLAADHLRVSGCEVVEAIDGESALEKVKLDIPGVILLDIQMPGIDGFEVIRRLKEDPSTAGIPVIAMTALAMKGDEERCMEAGFSDYISKPVDLNEMLIKVRVHITGGGGNE